MLEIQHSVYSAFKYKGLHIVGNYLFIVEFAYLKSLNEIECYCNTLNKVLSQSVKMRYTRNIKQG